MHNTSPSPRRSTIGYSPAPGSLFYDITHIRDKIYIIGNDTRRAECLHDLFYLIHAIELSSILYFSLGCVFFLWISASLVARLFNYSLPLYATTPFHPITTRHDTSHLYQFSRHFNTVPRLYTRSSTFVLHATSYHVIIFPGIIFTLSQYECFISTCVCLFYAYLRHCMLHGSFSGCSPWVLDLIFTFLCYHVAILEIGIEYW